MMSSGLLEINRWISVAPMMDWIGEGRKRLRYKNLQAAEMPRSLYVAATASFARGSKLSGWLAGERGDHALPTTLLPLSAIMHSAQLCAGARRRHGGIAADAT